MLKKFLIIFLGVLLLATFACSKSDKETVQNKSIQSGLDFVLQNIMTSENFQLSSFRDKIVVVDFWATWCPPCKMQVPVLNSVYQEYKPKGVEIVGISLDDAGKDVIQKFVNDYQIQYTIVQGDEDVMNLFGGIQGIPTMFIIDKNGNILKKHVGFMSKENLIEEIEKALI